MFGEMNKELETLKHGVMSLIMSRPLSKDQEKLIFLEESQKNIYNKNCKELNCFVIYEQDRENFSSTAGMFFFNLN